MRDVIKAKRARLSSCLAALGVCCTCLPALAAGLGDDETSPWLEADVSLPPSSKPVRPIRLDMGNVADNTFAVDAATIVVGKDGVIRFTTIVSSPNGATTITFEGIRCDSRERRKYAYGRADGTWSPARNARWTKIEARTINAYDNLLFREFFCPIGVIVRDAAEAVMALERGGHPATKQTN